MSNPNTPDGLKPCPFCGVTPGLVADSAASGGGIVVHYERTPADGRFKDCPLAGQRFRIADWNTRPSPVSEDGLVERLKELLAKATPGPWCWEQCGEKEDAPVIGIAWRLDDPTYTSVAGKLRDYDEQGHEVGYHRELIAAEIYGPDTTPSVNAALIIETINALPTLLSLIASQKAEIERLREALRPFAIEAGMVSKSAKDRLRYGDALFSCGALRKARAALASYQGEPK